MGVHFKRFFQELEESFFLLGPRGTGKTTWLATNPKRAVAVSISDIWITNETEKIRA